MAMSSSSAKVSIPGSERDAALNGKIHLLIVDDHPIVRLGLKALFSTQGDMEVVGLAENGESALKMVKAYAIDVMLVDLRMPGISGGETLRRIREFSRAPRAIIISSFECDEEIYAAVRFGAQGFVHKEAPAEDILSAIRAVARGRQAFPEHMRERLNSQRMTAGLSSRQIEILQLVAKGLTNKEVARALNLSQFTVRNHLNHITQKLDATDRTEAIFIALQTGLISPP
jgi:DNA-binding NarL/FixJ family response regulator